MVIRLPEVTDTLLDLTTMIQDYSEVVYIHQLAQRDAQDTLKQAEAVALLGATIDGKNEAIRGAQLYDATRLERIELEMADRKVLKAKLDLAAVEIAHKAWVEIANWHFGAR